MTMTCTRYPPFFVNLVKSIKYGIWASTYKNNQHLHHTFLNCRNNKTPIYLFFT